MAAVIREVFGCLQYLAAGLLIGGCCVAAVFHVLTWLGWLA